MLSTKSINRRKFANNTDKDTVRYELGRQTVHKHIIPRQKWRQLLLIPPNIHNNLYAAVITGPDIKMMDIPA